MGGECIDDIYESTKSGVELMLMNRHVGISAPAPWIQVVNAAASLHPPSQCANHRLHFQSPVLEMNGRMVAAPLSCLLTFVVNFSAEIS